MSERSQPPPGGQERGAPAAPYPYPPGGAGWAAPGPPVGPMAFPASAPSGLFPSRPPRPSYREPHPVRGGAVAAGLGAAALWMLFIGLLAGGLRSYAWWTALAGGVAWLVALGLARTGDRGVSAGVAIGSGIGIGVAAVAVALRWATTGDWPMW